MTTLLPFGTEWPMNFTLRERAAREREAFGSWIDALGIPSLQRTILTELLELMDEREFVEGRAACVTYEAELARRSRVDEQSLMDVLDVLAAAGLVTCHPACEVFDDPRPGMVIRIRRPDVVLTVEAAGPLWLADSWVRRAKEPA
ncbi:MULTISPECIES: hypothetical protein [Paenarthrobacter]|uniref:Uncharacterized protein n=1 Tax=Paenarthrobacter ureafaciens TaxID=37931 RepID=A0AAX3EQ41_PAEUR|nr:MULTISPECIES: hypothetical protein [Paenarthrobacter]MDO5867134.1 hypothetical protein [Paenarthrobacter sp. SD-2]MDO5878346.1 hypothetical protein [Paenarthrobacter sp. SD-1]UYV95574.1 hypothetical protein NL395_23405 [Paenarthrobacter ureafaciens]UYW00258.1 hypothetical protein NL394_24005 [Paenarthrobacter ureafaciens]